MNTAVVAGSSAIQATPGAYEFKYCKDQVICEGVAYFKFIDGASVPVHADLLRKQSEYTSPTLMNIIADTQDEINTRQIPVPDYITPAALDYYLCLLYGHDYDEVNVWFFPFLSSSSEVSSIRIDSMIEQCLNIAELYRWADVDYALYRRLDLLISESSRLFPIWDRSYGAVCCSNEKAFKFINAIEGFSDVLPLIYAQCLRDVLTVLTCEFTTKVPHDLEDTHRHTGMPLLLASSESFNLSPQTWRAVFYAFANAVRAPFDAHNFGSRAQVAKIDEATFMDRLNQYICSGRNSMKYTPLSFQLKTFHLSFKSDPPSPTGPIEEEEKKKENDNTWKELVTLDNPTYQISDTDERYFRSLNRAQICSDLLNNNERRDFEDFIKVVLESILLVAPGYYDTSTVATKRPRDGGLWTANKPQCMLVCVGVKKEYDSRLPYVKNSKYSLHPKYGTRKRPRLYYFEPPDIGKFSNVQVSFELEGVKFISPISNECLTGGFIGSTRDMPSNNGDELHHYHSPRKNNMQIFAVPCTKEFLQAACRVDAKNIHINLSCEVAYD